jgi:amidase
MQNAMSGPHPRDIATVRPKIEIPLELDTDLRGWRIAYSIDLGYAEVEPEVRHNTLEVLDVFRDRGATVEEVKLGWTPRIDDAANRYYAFAVGSYIEETARGKEDLLTDYARDSVEQWRKATPNDFLEAAAVCAEMYDDFGPLMERNDVFVCPTATTTRVKADHNDLHDSIEIDGKPVESDLGIALCHQFNMLSRCPVLAVPSGTASNGVPTGVQLVGPTYDDEKVFRAGAALEAVRPPFRDAESRPAL